MEIDINSTIEENNPEYSEDICPVHETKLIDGFCEICQVCYTCK